VPEIFEFGLAFDRLPIGEISDGIIPADRELRLVTTSRWYKNRRYKRPKAAPAILDEKR
jgi:hypothetical protein